VAHRPPRLELGLKPPAARIGRNWVRGSVDWIKEMTCRGRKIKERDNKQWGSHEIFFVLYLPNTTVLLPKMT
jgi:hypothetical protein